MQTALDLANNEGRPPGEEVLDKTALAPDLISRYASPALLEQAFADCLGANPDCVLATTGGDDAIDRVMRTFVMPGQEILFPVPTFEMIPAYARMAHAKLVPIEYEWGCMPHEDILAHITENTALVVLISPDNPTGHAFATAEIERLADALPPGVTLLLDAAYLDYADEDYTRRMLEKSNTVMIRSMSKAWGLAGLRVGFALGNAGRIKAMRNTGGPYPLTGPSIAIAQRCLQFGQAAFNAHIEQTCRWRPALADMMLKAGGVPLASQANFVLASFPDAAWIARGLAAQGIRVRRFDHMPGYIRVTVPRTDAEMAALDCALGCLIRDRSGHDRGPDAILFDMDGVLADVHRSYRETIVQTCALFGIAVGQAEIGAAKRAGNANDDWALTHRILKEAGIKATLGEVTQCFEDIYQGTGETPGLRRHETLIPTHEMLARLARSGPLGIVTGRPRSDADCFLTEHNIGMYFSAVICREDAPLKPDPAPVQAALDQLDARTAWLLGDTPDDVVAALGAGVVPIGVLSPGQNSGARRMARDALMNAGAARIVDTGNDYGGLFDG